MKTIWKTILTSAAKPFRLVIFIFGGYGKNKWRPAGRYTLPGTMKDNGPSAIDTTLDGLEDGEPAADFLIAS